MTTDYLPRITPAISASSNFLRNGLDSVSPK